MKLRYSSLQQVLTLSVLILAATAVTPLKAAQFEIYHTVIFWLKPDTSIAKINEIVASVKALEQLSMVEKVIVGTPVMNEREVVDDSFSIAFTMTFKSEAALAAYNVDPQHKASSKLTMAHVTRGVIYDYSNK
ncbi:MAG: hypothetical protein ACI9CE_001144 [Flavobacterium sp.]|jgi:hypothetical protein